MEYKLKIHKWTEKMDAKHTNRTHDKWTFSFDLLSSYQPDYRDGDDLPTHFNVFVWSYNYQGNECYRRQAKINAWQVKHVY